MKTWKLFLVHLVVFVAGTIGFGLYFAYKIVALPPQATLAVIVLLPTAVVYIGGFGLLCFTSFVVLVIRAHRRVARRTRSLLV